MNFVISGLIITQLARVLISILCFVYSRKWNDQAILLIGQILGFKYFLQVAEKYKIEQLSTDNSNYAFDMIAFAYIFGISVK